MADERSVVVRLKADTTAFQAKMAAAGRSAEKAFLSSATAAEKNRKALTTVGNAAGIMGAAAAAGVGLAIKASMDFDKAMSGVNAATHASGRQMENLRGLALKMGADTAFSATEAADGIEQLAKAGVSTKDIMGGGLKGALSLAAAGQMEVGDAAEAAATAMTQFGLSGNQVPHVADLLAAAAGKAQGEVSDFSQALNQSGLVANQTGLSIEETTGALGAFASQGLIGSDAGTSLKTMLQSLTPNSENASKAMEALGISAYDNQGQFIGLEKWAGRLRDGLSGLTDEQRNATLKTIFGSDAVRAASVIYEQGSQGIGKWIDKVNDTGYAADTAARKQDNLSGDLEKLQGAFSTLLITTGEGAQGPLRGLVQNLTDVTDAINSLPQPAKNAAFALGAITAVAGGAAFLGSRFITAIADGRAALTQLGLTAEKTQGKLNLKGVALRGGAGMLGGLILSMNTLDESADRAKRTMGGFANIAGGALMGFAVGGPIGAAIGGGVTAITTLVGALGDSKDAAQQAAQGAQQYKSTLNQVTGAVTDQTDAMVRNRLEQQGVLAAAEKLGLNTGTLVSAIAGGAPAAQAFNTQLSQVEARLTGINGKAPPASASLDDLLKPRPGADKPLLDQVQGIQAASDKYGNLLPLLTKVKGAYNVEGRAIDQARVSTQRKARADGSSAQASDKNTDATDAGTDAIKDETSALQANIDAHNRRTKAVLAGIDKNVAWEASIDDAAKEAHKGTKTLDINTSAGRDNISALTGMAAAWNDLPDKTKRAQGGIKEARQEFIRIAMQMGASREQAQKLAQQLLNIPNPKRKVEVDTQGASRDVDNFVSTMGRKLADIDDETVNVQLSGLAKLALQGQGPLTKFEFGGAIPGGMGTRGRDSVPAMLMPDEHVVTTSEVVAAGKGNAARGHRVWKGIRHAALVGALPDPMDLPAYATGGQVIPRVGNAGFPSAIRSIEAAFNGVVDQLGEQLSDRINEMYRFGGGSPLGPGGTLSRGQIMMGQRFAQAQDGKPYIWGAVGPNGYDCSGYQSAIINASLGRNPYQRIGSTGTMPWPGFKSGTGMYTIGWFTGDPGHTSGNIGGLGVESTGDHVRNGSAARSPLDGMFNHVAHYDTGGELHPGWTAAFNGTGDTEYVVRGYADGGKVTKAERQANREDRQAKREERQARREEREKQAREDARLFEHALKAFDITKKMGRGDVASELRDLRASLKEALGKDSPALKVLDRLDGHLLRNAVQQGKLLHSQEKLTESLKSLKDKRDQYAAGVAGTFRNEIFGGGLDDLSLQLNADTNDAKAMRRALQSAGHKGLSGGLYSGLAQSGNLLLAQQFADLSRKQIARYERLYAGRQGATGALGREAGSEVFGQRIHENSRALHRVHRELGHNTRQMRRLGRTLEKRVRRGDGGAHKRARGG